MASADPSLFDTVRWSVSSFKIIAAKRIPTNETVSYASDDNPKTDEELEKEQSFDFLLRKEFDRFDNTDGDDDGIIAVL